MAYLGHFQEKREPSTGERLARLSTQVVPDIAQSLAGAHSRRQEDAALKRMGYDVEGLGPDLKKDFVLNMMKQRAGGEGNNSLQGAIGALDEIEGLIDQEGIGMLGTLNRGEKARFNRGMFDSLQSAVLPLFKSMFPRGMTEKEFKFIQETYIPQTHDTEATIKGKIAGLRQLAGQQGMGGRENSRGNVQVFDKSGKHVGSVSSEEAHMLPEGYTAR